MPGARGQPYGAIEYLDTTGADAQAVADERDEEVAVLLLDHIRECTC